MPLPQRNPQWFLATAAFILLTAQFSVVPPSFASDAARNQGSTNTQTPSDTAPISGTVTETQTLDSSTPSSNPSGNKDNTPVFSNFTLEDIQSRINTAYPQFVHDPVFKERLIMINDDTTHYRTQHAVLKAFDDVRDDFVSQRKKDFVLFLKNYLASKQLSDMSDVDDFVIKIENQYFHFEKVDFGSSNPNDTNYYPNLLLKQSQLHSASFNADIRDYISESDLKRKKYFLDKINDYFYVDHAKEGLDYDKELKEAIASSLIKLYEQDKTGSHSEKYTEKKYSQFLASHLAQSVAEAKEKALKDFQSQRAESNILPVFIRRQANGNQLLTPENYAQSLSDLSAVLSKPDFLFSNRSLSDTTIISKIPSIAINTEDTKTYLQRAFDSSRKQILDKTRESITQSLSSSTEDKMLKSFLAMGSTDPDVQNTIDTALFQGLLSINRNNPTPVIDIDNLLDGADANTTLHQLKDRLKLAFEEKDLEPFRDSLKSALMKEFFLPGREKFVGDSPDVNARFQLISLLTMYDLYYENNLAAQKRLDRLMSVPVQEHRQKVFERSDRKVAVKLFREKVRGAEAATIAKASVNELSVAVALAVKTYVAPSTAPLTAMGILKNIASNIAPISSASNNLQSALTIIKDLETAVLSKL